MTAGLLIPPQRLTKTPGLFRWPAAAVLASPSGADLLPLGQLAGDLRKLGLRTRIERGAFGPAAVRIRRDANLKLGKPATRDEAYRLTVGAGGIEIVAASDAAAYYAVQTLRELLRVHGRALACARIEDWPDFQRRGVYHDCSRGKVPTLATLKDLVERLARWKINELQLYIENVFAFRRHPLIGKGYSSFTAAELLALQDHCKLHHVTLAGSLSSFGHMERILCLKPYRHLGEMPGTQGWAGGTTLCPGDPGSIKLIGELYEEFIPLFEERNFNICCDETWELGRGRSKARAEKVGAGRVYLDFVLRLHRLVQGYGKRTNAWSDILLGHPELLKDVPKDIVMLNWGYNIDCPHMARTGEIAAAGLPVVVCPGTSSWQTHGTRMENAMGNVQQASAQGRKHGAEGLLDTDWGDCGHRNFLGVSLHGFAHAAAHAWNGLAVDNAIFTRTFCRQALGQDNDRLAEGLVRLGRTYKVVSDDYYNNSALYWAMVEPIRVKKDARQDIAKCKPQGLRKVIADLGDGRLFPAAAGQEKFEAHALREFATAARMDVVAARRALAVQAIRSGGIPRTPELKALSADMKALAAEFSKLWLTRNKPSLLRENLRDLNKARTDLEKV